MCQNSVSGFLFYNVIRILPRSRVTQMDECSKLLQYCSNFLQRPLSCFKRSSEAGFRLFAVKKKIFWKTSIPMHVASNRYKWGGPFPLSIRDPLNFIMRALRVSHYLHSSCQVILGKYFSCQGFRGLEVNIFI